MSNPAAAQIEQRRDRPVSVVEQERVRRLVSARGERGAAAALHVSTYTLGRLLGGLPLREATRVLVAQQLGHLDGGLDVAR